MISEQALELEFLAADAGSLIPMYLSEVGRAIG
jgi:hypothetical protein